jgi:hypothetical protein
MRPSTPPPGGCAPGACRAFGSAARWRRSFAAAVAQGRVRLPYARHEIVSRISGAASGHPRALRHGLSTRRAVAIPRAVPTVGGAVASLSARRQWCIAGLPRLWPGFPGNALDEPLDHRPFVPVFGGLSGPRCSCPGAEMPGVPQSTGPRFRRILPGVWRPGPGTR